MASKHKALTLVEKLKVIEEHEKNKRPAKELTVLFNVGKSQIYNILKNKAKIKEEWVKGTAAHSKRIKKSMEFEEINHATLDWLVKARVAGMPVSGPLIRNEALETAKRLGKLNFRASNGWLESFKHRHGVVFNSSCGEATSGYEVRTLDDWKVEEEMGRDRSELVVQFDGQPIETEGIPAGSTEAPDGVCEVKEEVDDDDDDYEGYANPREEPRIGSFKEAMSAAGDLEEFAASRNVPKLLQLMQDAKEIIKCSLVNGP